MSCPLYRHCLLPEVLFERSFLFLNLSVTAINLNPKVLYHTSHENLSLRVRYNCDHFNLDEGFDTNRAYIREQLAEMNRAFITKATPRTRF
jgi:hypothetical protein